MNAENRASLDIAWTKLNDKEGRCVPFGINKMKHDEKIVNIKVNTKRNGALFKFTIAINSLWLDR